MGSKKKILKQMKEGNGVLRLKDYPSSELSPDSLRSLRKEGKIDKVSRGIYVLKEEAEDTFYLSQSRFKKGIYSHESALALHGMIDRIPSEPVMTFPRSYNVTKVGQQGIKTYRVVEKYHLVGIQTIFTYYGNEVVVYNLERSLCDIVRPNSRLSIELVVQAFQNYARHPMKNLSELWRYAALFHVENKVRSYMEVLL